MVVGGVDQLLATIGEGGPQAGQGELVRQGLKTLGQLRLHLHGGVRFATTSMVVATASLVIEDSLGVSLVVSSLASSDSLFTNLCYLTDLQ